MEPHERGIAHEHFGPEREVYAILPRGNLKTTLAAKIGLHHLLVTPGGSVTLGAASRDQARILFERMRGRARVRHADRGRRRDIARRLGAFEDVAAERSGDELATDRD